MLTDAMQRPIHELRISITDRCNFRCLYCMPLAHYERIERKEVLSYEEIARLAKLFVGLGVEKIRITGGEPLVRLGVEELVDYLAGIGGLRDLCMTTNGFLLSQKASALAAAGLKRINVSIDALDPKLFKDMTGRDDLAQVLSGLDAARQCGLHPIKINSVVIRGVNDHQILPLVEFARSQGFSLRFIEFMDAGNVNHWRSERLVPKREIVAAVQSRFKLQGVGRRSRSSPESLYRFEDGAGDLGVVASVTEPFCDACTRARLTADGKLVTCLFSDRGCELKPLVRRGASDREIQDLVASVWGQRNDRYSEERQAAMNSANGYTCGDRAKIEMIKLGG
jgi:cyclic pyranopterin phosphate synthase